MYIFELILKYIRGKNYKQNLSPNILTQNDTNKAEDDEDCIHLFMPVDSSGEVLACKYCGLIIYKNDYKS